MMTWIPERARCELRANPLGVQTERPRFDWRVPDIAGLSHQMAYQLVVANAADRLGQGADVWDGGWVESAAPQATYSGPPLGSRQGRRRGSGAPSRATAHPTSPPTCSGAPSPWTPHPFGPGPT
jgi:hypothetical protein